MPNKFLPKPKEYIKTRSQKVTRAHIAELDRRIAVYEHLIKWPALHESFQLDMEELKALLGGHPK